MGQGKGAGDCCKVCGAATLCCVVCIIVIAFAGIGIAKIVMGALYIHDCGLQYLVPIYLIVSGLGPVMYGGFSNRNQEDGDVNICGLCCGIIGFLFNLAWLICGSVWVYPTYSTVHSQTTPCSANGTMINSTHAATDCMTCDKTLVNFAFGMVTLDWICLVFWIVLLCCMIVMKCNK